MHLDGCGCCGEELLAARLGCAEGYAGHERQTVAGEGWLRTYGRVLPRGEGLVCAPMDVAIVAPCPVPYTRGGAENLWSGLQDHLNQRTAHQAEVIKLPARERGLWELVESYRAFSELDLSSFDVVISGKYPAWMVRHPRHLVYMLHRLRGLYDTYHYFGLPERVDTDDTDVRGLLSYMTDHAGERDALPEFFERVASLRARRSGLAPELLAFPGPLVRALVHWLDGVGMSSDSIARYGAISDTVRTRGGGEYFPPRVDVFVVHPPSQHSAPARVKAEPRFGAPYLFTVSRLDRPKRVDVLIKAMRLVRTGDARLQIAGTGPDEERLRELAADDERIAFRGRVSDAELQELYAGARGVAFIPYDEDFGLVTLEAMGAGRPVITASDTGGPMELVEPGVTGWVVDATPEALAGAVDELWADRGRRRRMGAVARERASHVTWDPLLAELEALA